MTETPRTVERPIGPYPVEPARVEDWDPRTEEVARRVAELVTEHRPDLRVEHTGSSAVPGLPGKNVVDLGIEADAADVARVAALLEQLGFQRQRGPRSFPPTRPLYLGSLEHAGRTFRIHAHVLPRGHRVYGRHHARDVAFRDALRRDPALREAYASRKRDIVAASPYNSYRYSMAKTEWIQATLAALGHAERPIEPPATIGILGGGQLGRMLGFAARTLGYRIAIVDPDPACPAAAVADRVVVGAYDDVDAALEMAAACDVVTIELEHVGFDLVARLDWDWYMRPGPYAVFVTQDRLNERRFLEAEGATVAVWREVATIHALETAIDELGPPCRLKAPRGGYDGRSQLRISAVDEAASAFDRLGGAPGRPLLVERELAFAAELSVVCARGVDGRTVVFPPARNRHDEGILVESVAPAPVAGPVAPEAQALAARLAEGLDLVGTLAVEMFLMPDDTLVVNELAPRVHNSGHWTDEACRTSQFEQHIRAICGLPLGSTALEQPAALVNLLGVGERRAARLHGVDEALRDPNVSVHVYDKREVFERRKMGHVVATADSVDEALERAWAARRALRWGHSDEVGP